MINKTPPEGHLNDLIKQVQNLLHTLLEVQKPQHQLPSMKKHGHGSRSTSILNIQQDPDQDQDQYPSTAIIEKLEFIATEAARLQAEFRKSNIVGTARNQLNIRQGTTVL
jgi:arginyl-tRNA synthetase